jgi:hypothetical protein
MAVIRKNTTWTDEQKLSAKRALFEEIEQDFDESLMLNNK